MYVLNVYFYDFRNFYLNCYIFRLRVEFIKGSVCYRGFVCFVRFFLRLDLCIGLVKVVLKFCLIGKIFYDCYM